MQIYVLTCDKYAHLMPGFAHLFNTYWSPLQTVDVLGFGSVPDLPGNFHFTSLAPTETKPWTDHMLAYFSGCKAERFVLLLDDYWLISQVDLDQVKKMDAIVEAGAAKGDLSTNTYNLGATAYNEDADLWLANQNARYRSSTQPCIWSRDYLLKMLVPGRNIWRFEVLGAREAINDGAKIVGPRHQIYQYANIYKKGKVDMHEVNKIRHTDHTALREALSMLDII